MKINSSTQGLGLFAIYLLFSAVISHGNCNKSTTNMKNPLKGYYWIQRMYPGSDPIENIKESEFNSALKFLEVNDEMIFFTDKEEKKEDIEDSISLLDLYDDKLDNVNSAICCQRIAYEEFPAGRSLQTIIPAIPAKVLKAASKKGQSIQRITKGTSKTDCCPSKQTNPVTAPSVTKKQARKGNNPIFNANYCLTLQVPDEARWRICNDKQEMISKLQLKIIFSVLKKKSKNSPSIMEKLLDKANVGKVPDTGKWSWDYQNKWGGKCQTTHMQSPINVKSTKVTTPETHFSVSFHFSDVHTLIKKNFDEVIVTFLNFGGIMKLAIDNTYVIYTPQFMSFRFPGESIIDGERFGGEIQLHLAELSSQRVNNKLYNILVENCNIKWTHFNYSNQARLQCSKPGKY
jgi:hypothetical protein